MPGEPGTILRAGLSGGGLCRGSGARHSGEPVCDHYPGKALYAFTGGTINRVAVGVSGDPYVDLERQAEMLIRSRERVTYADGKDRPGLRLLVLDDDAKREFDYTTGAEKSLQTAAAQGWTVASIKND